EVVVIGYGTARKKEMTGAVYGVQVTPGKSQGAPTSYLHDEEQNTEGYDFINENGFLKSSDNPLSTFSIDVDAASYSNVRRMLNTGQLPPAGAVRIEELINYFQYDYPQPKTTDPFSFTTEMSECPWNTKHKLVLIGMQGKKIPVNDLPASNLVFLIDVSGSMSSANKLPLVKESLKLLIDQLREEDKVSIVVYAGAAGLVLPPTSGSDKTAIKDALQRLEAGGSTAGGAGIQLAYKTARENFRTGANNRVILCSDGDFNIGMSSDDDMERLIEKERTSGVYLTVLGYGMGNYKDNKMQKLADKGNGNHAYIDGINEAKKVLVNEFGGTLFTIAKDVKLQVEFNPAKVQAYRLVGYENRLLKNEDFNNDKKDAGELGSGHTVTAMYEIIPAGIKSDFVKDIDALKYQKNPTPSKTSSFSNELMTIKFRYKTPGSETSKLMLHAVNDELLSRKNTSENFRFAAAVAEFGILLLNSEFKADASYGSVLQIAKTALNFDTEGYRREFIRLVETAQLLGGNRKLVIEHDSE
ncbi:MAG: von Willebrand factor type A domain-containing protein, partial [Gloeobacteraceae cyanobacterium ES-bin-316]|nr:von Willebrand factor type A domain-containing protein [Ferruginibacter sp.]